MTNARISEHGSGLIDRFAFAERETSRLYSHPLPQARLNLPSAEEKAEATRKTLESYIASLERDSVLLDELQRLRQIGHIDLFGATAVHVLQMDMNGVGAIWHRFDSPRSFREAAEYSLSLRDASPETPSVTEVSHEIR